jgi:predicted Fe-S protein YdhL (DUF1289 family)
MKIAKKGGCRVGERVLEGVNWTTLSDDECKELWELAKNFRGAKNTQRDASKMNRHQGVLNHYIGLLGETAVAKLLGGVVDRAVYRVRDRLGDIRGVYWRDSGREVSFDVKMKLVRYHDFYIRRRVDPEVVYVFAQHGWGGSIYQRKTPEKAKEIRTVVAWGWMLGKEVEEVKEQGNDMSDWRVEKWRFHPLSRFLEMVETEPRGDADQKEKPRPVREVRRPRRAGLIGPEGAEGYAGAPAQGGTV